MNRKISQFEIKAEGTPGRFTGRASVYNVLDFYGDVVLPGAFTKSLQELGGEIVVLYQHGQGDSIGKAKLIDRADGLWAEGRLELDLPIARDAYTRLQKGLLTGISIGYNVPPGGDSLKDGVRYIHQIDLMEISLVTFPANTHARITDVKRGVANAAEVLGSLKRLSASMKAFNDQMRAERHDPVIYHLSRMSQMLTHLRKSL